MDNNIQEIVPYLKDPLTLVGICFILSLSFVRFLVRNGVIPPLSPPRGADVLKTILKYGFILGLVITLLGFGLEYREISHAEQQNREISHAEQQNIVKMLHQEFKTNIQVAAELAANVQSILENSNIVAELLRHKSIPILSTIFPMENMKGSVAPPSVATADRVLKQLENSGLLNNPEEVMKFSKVGEAISATIDRTFPTLVSLADQDRKRFQFTKEIWTNHLDVLRKINIIDITTFQETYGALSNLRNDYDVVVKRCLDYLESVRNFFQTSNSNLSSEELARVLASERLAFSSISRYGNSLATHSEKLVALQETLNSESPYPQTGASDNDRQQ